MSLLSWIRALPLVGLLALGGAPLLANLDIPSLDAEAAHERVTGTDAILLDVRTRAELQFVGAPDPLDAHVPFMKLSAPMRWDNEGEHWQVEPNEAFVSEVEDALRDLGASQDDEIVVLCRSGSRSLAASRALAEAGFEEVLYISDGFEGDRDGQGYRRVNGWLNAGLPIARTLPADRVYQ